MTKTELEARVVELEAQLASGIPEGSFTQAEMDAALAQAKAGIGQIEQELEERVTEASSLRGQLVEAGKRIEAAAKVTPVSSGDGVVLGGVKCGIIFQDSVLELIDAWRKKLVDETDIAIVVKRV